ncbi:hypothetical protein O9X81_18080 [Agrobacterium salinitolerans]|uniref:hypothetical protein n=1 Tax=Agrobacterium salinitolerans TaxID=1183413 RepID=UPI0022B85517|nr:hypothetical protein [Agrobacterium salinitolerans]MCZ7858538.1 hypothetical protein [Agrobacterium salinitolerans]
MRNQPFEITEILNNVKDDSLIDRKAVWIVAKNRQTGLKEGLGVWNGDEDVGLTVIEGENGTTVTRPYYGGGNLLSIGDIPRVSDFTIQTVTIDLSKIADIARKIAREYDVHRAYVEIHAITLRPTDGMPAAPEEPVFIGIVDGAPIKTPRIGGQGKGALKIVSELMRMLGRSNPEKSSYEAQRLRDGDEFYLYAGQIDTWEIAWGTK